MVYVLNEPNSLLFEFRALKCISIFFKILELIERNMSKFSLEYPSLEKSSSNEDLIF